MIDAFRDYFLSSIPDILEFSSHIPIHNRTIPPHVIHLRSSTEPQAPDPHSITHHINIFVIIVNITSSLALTLRNELFRRLFNAPNDNRAIQRSRRNNGRIRIDSNAADSAGVVLPMFIMVQCQNGTRVAALGITHLVTK